MQANTGMSGMHNTQDISGMHGAHAMHDMDNMPSMQLVPLSAVTHRAVASGPWSDPTTWEGGRVPDAWAKVHVPAGLDVQVDGMISPPVKTLRVDGTLSFANTVNTELRVDTLVTTMSGHLVIGTASAPIAADVEARIVFADDGAIDRSTDPSLIGRGALLHGKTTINGAEKTAFTTVETFPRAGDTEIRLSTAPVGWKVGDEIVIAGTDPNDPASDEKVTITSIDGTTIGIDKALVRDHVAPRADLEVHVANLTRNVEFLSENPATAHRGHVMVMHTNDASMNFVSFDDLGRSDKALGYNDHEFVDLDPFIPPVDLGGDNVRGRYSVHFHRGGTDKDGAPATVNGAVVTDDIGWGFVNHSSHVNFSNNVTHNIVGTAYFTEAGDEIGSFINNIALRTVNPSLPLKQPPGSDSLFPDLREDRMDFGFQGDGFWFHGPNVRVEGNVVSGASGHAYIWWPEGLLERTADGQTQKAFHDTANVPNGNLIGPDGTRMEIFDVPMGRFDNNQAYSATKGIEIFYLHTEFFGMGVHREDGVPFPPPAYFNQLRSTVSNATIWAVEETAVAAPYVNRVTFDSLRAVGNGDPSQVGVDLGHFQNNIGLEVRNATIEDFGVGLQTTARGGVTVEGGNFSGNQIDFQQVIRDDDQPEQIVLQIDRVTPDNPIPSSVPTTERPGAEEEEPGDEEPGDEERGDEEPRGEEPGEEEPRGEEPGEEDPRDEPEPVDPGAIGPSMLALFYIVFLGRLPDEGGFGSWLRVIEANPALSDLDLAAVFATSPEFVSLTDGDTPGDVVDGIYLQVLNRPADEEGRAFWAGVLTEAGTNGVVELGLGFVRARETDMIHGEAVDEFLDSFFGGTGGRDEDAMPDPDNGDDDMPGFDPDDAGPENPERGDEAGEGAGDDSGDDRGDEDGDDSENQFLDATPAADQFLFPTTGYVVITGFDPSMDRIDISGLGTFGDLEILDESDGTTLFLGGGEIFVADVEASALTADSFLF
ncbi:MAG: G8 domain-containing protein [Pseudomonadota bacterium]